MKNYKDYKYVMIVTSEDKRYDEDERYENNDKYSLSWFGEHPWEGTLVDIVFGNSFDDLMGDGNYEGLFQQTYDVQTGKRISYGFLDYNTPREEIEEFEKNNKNPIIKWEDVVKDIAEHFDWNVTINNNIFTFQMFTSHGRYFDIKFEADNFKTLCDKLENYYDNFDVSKETYLCLDNSGHGKIGTLYDMLDVYKNMEECKDKINELIYHLNNGI